MKKHIVESVDMFLDKDWLGDARDAQNRLESIKNPYVGNKRKILISLTKVLEEANHIDNIEGSAVLDLFSGSSFVGYLFKWFGASVWSNDLLAASFVNALYLVETDSGLLRRDIMKLVTKVRDNPKKRVVGSQYEGTRFTSREAKILDSISENFEGRFGRSIEELIISAYSKSIPIMGELWQNKSYPSSVDSGFAHALASILYYIMDHCYVGGRLNCGQLLANVDHRIAHQRNNGEEMRFDDMMVHSSIQLPSKNRCIATRMDAMNLLKRFKPKVDFVYIDPPYGDEQSDYPKMYEFFEFYLGFENKSEEEEKRFTKSKKYQEQFEDLVSNLPPDAVWIFSYNNKSWANIDTIKDCIKNARKGSVESWDIDYRYNYCDKENMTGTEYIVIATP